MPSNGLDMYFFQIIITKVLILNILRKLEKMEGKRRTYLMGKKRKIYLLKVIFSFAGINDKTKPSVKKLRYIQKSVVVISFIALVIISFVQVSNLHNTKFIHL